MQNVITNKAPEPLGPYSQAVIIDKIVYVAMQLPIRADGSSVDMAVNDSVAVQTGYVMDNIEAILKEAGSSMRAVVKATIYLTDLKDGKNINAVYEKYFTDILPARSLVNVKELPFGYKVAADVIAKLI